MARLLAAFMLITASLLLAAADKPKDAVDQKDRLAKVQQLVGAWRGVGQPQRGSTKDSWVEEADWVWSFAEAEPALVAKLPQGKYFKALKLVAGSKNGQYTLLATPAAGGDEIRYGGQLDDQGQLVLNAENPVNDLPQRLSFRFVANGDRLLVLLERKSATSDQLVRRAEIGYTRQGSGFGKNTAQRECIVTGGLGTIEVSYEGKTYYVCCTGCRDYFNDDPKKVLAEYVARKESEKAKAK